MSDHILKECGFYRIMEEYMTKTNLTRRSVMQTGAVAGAGLAMPTILTAGSHSGFANAPTGSSVTLGLMYHNQVPTRMRVRTNYELTNLPWST